MSPRYPPRIDGLVRRKTPLRREAELRSYRFDKYKTKEKPEQKPTLEEVTIVVAGPAEARRAYAGMEPAIESVFFTRT